MPAANQEASGSKLEVVREGAEALLENGDLAGVQRELDRAVFEAVHDVDTVKITDDMLKGAEDAPLAHQAEVSAREARAGIAAERAAVDSVLGEFIGESRGAKEVADAEAEASRLLREKGAKQDSGEIEGGYRSSPERSKQTMEVNWDDLAKPLDRQIERLTDAYAKAKENVLKESTDLERRAAELRGRGERMTVADEAEVRFLYHALAVHQKLAFDRASALRKALQVTTELDRPSSWDDVAEAEAALQRIDQDLEGSDAAFAERSLYWFWDAQQSAWRDFQIAEEAERSAEEAEEARDQAPVDEADLEVARLVRAHDMAKESAVMLADDVHRKVMELSGLSVAGQDKALVDAAVNFLEHRVMSSNKIVFDYVEKMVNALQEIAAKEQQTYGKVSAEVTAKLAEMELELKDADAAFANQSLEQIHDQQIAAYAELKQRYAEHRGGGACSAVEDLLPVDLVKEEPIALDKPKVEAVHAQMAEEDAEDVERMTRGFESVQKHLRVLEQDIFDFERRLGQVPEDDSRRALYAAYLAYQTARQQVLIKRALEYGNVIVEDLSNLAWEQARLPEGVSPAIEDRLSKSLYDLNNFKLGYAEDRVNALDQTSVVTLLEQEEAARAKYLELKQELDMTATARMDAAPVDATVAAAAVGGASVERARRRGADGSDGRGPTDSTPLTREELAAAGGVGDRAAYAVHKAAEAMGKKATSVLGKIKAGGWFGIKAIGLVALWGVYRLAKLGLDVSDGVLTKISDVIRGKSSGGGKGGAVEKQHAEPKPAPKPKAEAGHGGGGHGGGGHH